MHGFTFVHILHTRHHKLKTRYFLPTQGLLMKVQPPTNPPFDPSGTKDTQAVKPSKDFEEVLAEINAGLRDLHFRVLELEESSKGERKT